MTAFKSQGQGRAGAASSGAKEGDCWFLGHIEGAINAKEERSEESQAARCLTSLIYMIVIYATLLWIDREQFVDRPFYPPAGLVHTGNWPGQLFFEPALRRVN